MVVKGVKIMLFEPQKSLLDPKQIDTLLETLKKRFLTNQRLHLNISWEDVQNHLLKHKESLTTLYHMEITGGQPALVDFDVKTNQYLFFDCSKETPIGRRSLCYDHEALNSRKLYKPQDSVLNMAKTMGIEVMSEKEYRMLQSFGPYDQKTSSWILTPPDIRKKGGALFGDFRYGNTFIYHNGADSYYGSRGFRGYRWI